MYKQNVKYNKTKKANFLSITYFPYFSFVPSSSNFPSSLITSHSPWRYGPKGLTDRTLNCCMCEGALEKSVYIKPSLMLSTNPIE